MTLIDRDAIILKRRFMVATDWSGDHDGYAVLVKDIYDAPTIEASPVVHGQWVHTDYAKHWTSKDECSECSYHSYDREDLTDFNYCPNCGAKMDGGNDNV